MHELAEDSAWVELEWEQGEALWEEFDERFRFQVGEQPVIEEPAPSITWSLAAVFAGDDPGGFVAGRAEVATVVLRTLQACTDWYETVAFHDWVHPSALLRPHKAGGLEDVPGWENGGLFPNGDYTVFVNRDYTFGIVGHPLEMSLCVFGEQALAAVAAADSDALTVVLRRDGKPWRI